MKSSTMIPLPRSLFRTFLNLKILCALDSGRGTGQVALPATFFWAGCLGVAALLLADLGVTKTRSRHHVSDDNPFSESQVKTLKYRPEFPERFGSI